MAIPLQTIRQRDFSAGEIDPDAERREDRDEFKYGVRFARNLRSNKAGNLERRGSRMYLYQDSGRRDEFKPFGNVQYAVTFADSRVTIRLQSGLEIAELAAPWGADDVDSLVWEFYENRIFVCWSGRPQVITVDSDTLSWAIDDYDFANTNDEFKCPFFRFKADGSTLHPSAYTGSSITVQFSVDILDPLHVGVVFLYAGRQLRITAVTDARNGTAEVIEELPPTWRITVFDVDGYKVGQLCETSLNNMTGEIVSINGSVIDVVATDTFRRPQQPSGQAGEEGDRLVTESAYSGITAVAKLGTPSASTIWLEQFMSPYRGWPRSVSKDSQRLIFCDFPQFKQAIVWSAVSDPFDLLVAGEATGAIFEYIDQDCQVFHVIGGYDEFAITDIGVFYIPISTGTPLQPGSVEFRIIYSDEVSNVRPARVTEGVMFVDSARTGIYSIAATGQTARPYIANEVTELHRHLFSGIKSLQVRAGSARNPAREIFAVNDDGTVVSGQYNPTRQFVGWLKWGNGFVHSIASRYGTVVFTTTYTFPEGDLTVAEQLLDDGVLDCSVSFTDANTAAPLNLGDGGTLDLDDGASLQLDFGVVDALAGKTVDVMVDGFYAGQHQVESNGTLPGFDDYDTVTAGIVFGWQLTPLIEAFEGGEAFGQRERRRKIADVKIKVRETQEFRVGNRLFGSYRGGEDMTVPVPQRDDVYRYKQNGRSYDPQYTLENSGIPGSFKVTELTTKVTV